MCRSVLVLFAAFAAPAWGAFVLTLDQTSISGTPGSLITLTGSILNENPVGEDVVNIANTVLTGSGGSLSQVFAPAFIAYGATYTGNLIEVAILAASPGVYPANLSFEYDTFNGRLATTNAAAFSVEVLPTTEIPEPSTGALMLLGLAAAAIRRSR